MKQYPYIYATGFAILLAIIVWWFTPNEYTAITEVADEYQESELFVGITPLEARIKEAVDGYNTGLNDIEIYCQVLKTKDFASAISHKQVPGKSMTYGQYLGAQDTLSAILEHINYNLKPSQNTLKISFTDRDALVASQMLDSVTVHLQTIVTRYRFALASTALEYINQERNEAAEKHHTAMKKYAAFADAHTYTRSESVVRELQMLENEADMTYKNYKNTVIKSVRMKALQQKAYLSFAVIKNNTVPLHTDKHLMGYLICFVVIALSFVKAYVLFQKRRTEQFSLDLGNIFSPWFLTIGVWGGIMLLLTLFYNQMDPLSNCFFIDITLWITILCITSFCTFHLMSAKQENAFGEIDINIYFFHCLYALGMILTPLYIYQIYRLASMFGTADLMYNLRQLALYGGGYGFLNYTFVINEVLLLIALWKYPKIPLWQLMTIILACLLYAIGNMEKITFFLVFVSIIFMLYEKKKIKMRWIIIGSLSVIIIFYFFNLARSGDDSEYAQNESLFDFIAMYILSGPVAYGRLQPTITDQFGSDTLWSIYLYFGKYFQGTTETHQPLQEFVFVPMSTNVYTVMRPYYTDFGHWGVAFFAYLYGILSGACYRLYRNGNTFGTCLYTYLTYILVLQFFDEFITASLPLIIQMLILLFIVTQNKLKFSFQHSKS